MGGTIGRGFAAGLVAWLVACGAPDSAEDERAADERQHAQPSETERAAHGGATAPPTAEGCSEDEDCVLSDFADSPCGRCGPPRALNRAWIAQQRAAARPSTIPANCTPCGPYTAEEQEGWPDAARCTAGRCEAIVTGARD